MEAAGLAIGVLGLAGLYSTCIEVLDALSAAARFGVDRELLQTKLEVERVRLMIWGDSVGLTEIDLGSSKSEATKDDLAVIDESLQRPALRIAVAGLLACFVRAFEDVEELQKRYGLVPQPENKENERAGALTTPALPATTTATATSAAAASSSALDRPTRSILSATFRKTYASFQGRTAAAQKQATPLTRARWAVVDEPKFRALISELKAVNDSLTSLLPAVRNKTRVRMRAEIMQSNDVAQLQSLVSAADDMTDLISETASLRLEMLSTRGESVPRRPQPRLVHVSNPAAPPQPTAETPQPTLIPQPAAVPTLQGPPPLPVASPPPGPPEPTLDAYDDAGALVIHKVYSKPDSLSCYAWVSGQWEVPDLSEIQPAFHPAFNLVFIPDSILSVAENVLEVDVVADPRYAGWSPGSTSLTGFAREITFWRQAVKEVEQSQKGWLRATNPPSLTSDFILQRWNSIVKNGLGEDWTEKKGHDQLRKLIGPSDYTWLDPEEGFKIRHQISDLLAEMRTTPLPSLETTASIGCLATSDPNRGDGNFGMIDFLFQMVKAREVTLRIARSQRKWHGGITARIVYDLVAAELWRTKLEYKEDIDAFQVTGHAKEEQIDGIVKFAEEMKWPYVDEMRETAAKLRRPDTENTAGIDMRVWDWMNGLFLPGSFFQSSLMGVLSALSPTLRSRLPRATIRPREGTYGIVYPQASYWCVRSVVGKVLAPMSTATTGADGTNANASGIKCLGGWVGPCPSPSLPESTFGLIVQLEARPPTFPTGDDPTDPDALETRNVPAFATESKRASNTIAWTEPTPPPGPGDTVTLQTLRLNKLPAAPAGSALGEARAPQYRARLDFRLARSRTMATVTLHANSVFVAAPACQGGPHRVDPRRAAAYAFRVLALEELPRSEPGAATTVINAAGGGAAETFARAWCSQKGVDAVVWQRDAGRSCFKCALMVAGQDGLGLKVLIMV